MATIDSFIKKVEELEGVSYPSFLDVTQYFAPDKICVKLLLKLKFPGLKEEDIEDFIEDEAEGLTKLDDFFIREEEEEEKLEDERELQEGSSDNDNESKRQARRTKREQIREENKIKRELRKEQLKQQLQERKKIYKDRIVEYIEEVKKIKREVRAAVHKLFAEFFNLAQKLVTGLIKAVQAIVAVVMKIVAPPWNIPDAIVTLISVVEFFLDIIKQLKVVAPILEPLRQLGIIIEPSKLGVVTSLLNSPITFILGLFNPFAKFDRLVGKLMQKLLDLIGSSDKKKRVFKKATRKLRKYGYCNNEDINSLDEDDYAEVSELLETYKLGNCSQAGFSVNRCSQCVIGYRDDEAPDTDDDAGSRRASVSGTKLDAGDFSPSSSGDFTSIKDENGNSTTLDAQLRIFEEFSDIAGTIRKKRQQAESEGNFVYDVLLPDGTILANQTQESLDRLRRDYQLLFTNLE